MKQQPMMMRIRKGQKGGSTAKATILLSVVIILIAVVRTIAEVM